MACPVFRWLVLVFDLFSLALSRPDLLSLPFFSLSHDPFLSFMPRIFHPLFFYRS